MRAIVLPAALQKSRQPEEVEAFDFVYGAGRLRKQRVDFAEESGEPAQIHLIVPHHSSKWLGRPAAQIVEVILGNKRRSHIVFAMPAQTGRVKDVTFQV